MKEFMAAVNDPKPISFSLIFKLLLMLTVLSLRFVVDVENVFAMITLMLC